MVLRKHDEMILALLRYAVNGIELPLDVFAAASGDDWKRCYAMAVEQGVMPVAWDAVMALPGEMQPPRTLKLNWALAVEKYAKTHARYCKAVGELSRLYASHGISTVQFKGVGLSTYYPVPERRQGGDIDIYTYSADASRMSDEEANALADNLMRDRGVNVDRHSYKHSNFTYKGIPIENHRCFTSVNSLVPQEVEDFLVKNLNPSSVIVGDEEINVPSLEFNSVYIVVHALQHVGDGLCLHHLCDWACVLKKIGPELAVSMGGRSFVSAVKCMNLMCRDYLGSELPEDSCDGDSEELMQEILHPKFLISRMPRNPLGMLWYKTRKFAWAARMKSMVWNCSVWGLVWSSVAFHLKHPKLIFGE